MSWRDHSQLIPLFGSIIWFGMLWAMLGTWLGQGRPKYVSQDGSIAYISDVGADILKPLFITGGSITSVCFVTSLSIERWLRHRGRLLPNMRRREKVMSSLAIASSVLGGAGIILLSVFDTKRFMRLHRVFLLVFMVGVAFSAIFTIAEFAWLKKEFHYHTKLKAAYMAKLIIVSILVAAAVAFAVCLQVKKDVGAILEWAIAFGFTFYLLTFWFDLRQAKGVPKGAAALKDPQFRNAEGMAVV